jgi:hypothetical protein
MCHSGGDFIDFNTGYIDVILCRNIWCRVFLEKFLKPATDVEVASQAGNVTKNTCKIRVSVANMAEMDSNKE